MTTGSNAPDDRQSGSGVPTVSLPEAGDGSRSGRAGRGSGGAHRAPKAERPRRTAERGRGGGGGGSHRPPRGDGPRLPAGRPLLLGALALLGLGVLVVVGFMVLDLFGGDDEGSSATTTTVPAGALAGETALLLQKDAAGALVAATLFVVGPSGEGGDVVYIPPGTLAEVPSLGLTALRDASREGGDAATRQALENLLGQALPTSVSLDPAALAAAVEPAGVLTISLPAPVERRDAEGRVEVLFDDGEVAVTSAEVPALLEAPAETDLDRLVRHQAFWDGWFAALTGGGDLGPIEGGAGDVIAAVAEGEVAHRLLPVQAVAASGDLYQVDRAGLAAMLAEVLPDATPPADRIRVQILNGTGAPGLTQQVQPLLVAIGADVTLTGNADRFDYPVTQIVFYDEADEPDARRVREALGFGEVVRSRDGLDVVDLTVVVGADFTPTAAGTPPDTTPTTGA